jgi:hypothetical protein
VYQQKENRGETIMIQISGLSKVFTQSGQISQALDGVS